MENQNTANPKKPTHYVFIERQNNCPLCNTLLDIKTEISDEGHNLREEAHCPKCEVLARVKDHTLN